MLALEPRSRFLLFYGNRTTASTMFLEDVLALKNRWPARFAVHFLMSREPQDVEAPGDMTRMKAFSATFSLAGEEPTEVLDITKRVREAIQQFPVTTGIALINTMHTTCALFINEFQHALVDDLKSLAERLVPERGGYRHDDPRYSGCERGNAHAHLHGLTVGLAGDAHDAA